MYRTVFYMSLLTISFVYSADKSRDFDSCIDRFCPLGRYCIAITASKCINQPCKPIIACVPNEDNGCVGMSCPTGRVCVERTVPCIGKSCRKTGKCVEPNSCDSITCPPSHKCESIPNPHCVHTILNGKDVSEMVETAKTGH